MEWGLYGGIIGGVVGIAGGAIGTYFSIVNTKSRAERRFMISASLYVWIGLCVLLLLLFTLPRPYNMLVWVPYGIALPLSIRHINKRQIEIRGTHLSGD